MTWPACGADPPACGAERPGGQRQEREDLWERSGRDGSFSLWSQTFGEGFHSGRGALREARETFLTPSAVERFRGGRPLRVVEVCVGTGSNLAVLLEACAALGVRLEWRGLEIDPRPLERALAAPAFRLCWQPETLQILEQLHCHGDWQANSQGAILWGDARSSLAALLRSWQGSVDLIWLDAFSPQRCPQLWTQDWLRLATGLLNQEGRWITYCSAAAVREGLRRVGLELAALVSQSDGAPGERNWSGGTVACRRPLAASPHWRALTTMEWEHLASTAGEPYRDPSGTATAAAIVEHRRQAQAAALARGERESSSAWRERWGLARHRFPHP